MSCVVISFISLVKMDKWLINEYVSLWSHQFDGLLLDHSLTENNHLKREYLIFKDTIVFKNYIILLVVVQSELVSLHATHSETCTFLLDCLYPWWYPSSHTMFSTHGGEMCDLQLYLVAKVILGHSHLDPR